MTSNLKASVMEDQDVWKHLSESAVSTAVKNDDYDDVIIQTIQKKKIQPRPCNKASHKVTRQGQEDSLGLFEGQTTR